MLVITKIKDVSDMYDHQNNNMRFDLGDNNFIVLGRETVEAFNSMQECLKALGFQPQPSTRDVIQRGQKVGTLSTFWTHSTCKPTLMYIPRSTDFKLENDTWIADPMLGLGDLLHAGVNLLNKPDW